MEKVLITGGTGLIGKHLTILLMKNGYEVLHLSRKKNLIGAIKTYEWNEEKNLIDEQAVLQADHVIHLAGASVAKRWTTIYKQKLLDSRVKTANMIFEVLKRNKNHLKTFISSSAVGFYADGKEEWLNENSPAGKSFLSQICIEWEAAANKFALLNKRVAIIRTGLVLAKEGGSFPELYNPIRLGIAPIFGNGKQFYPWIHIDDLCRMYLFALQNESVKGIFNGCAPKPQSQIELMNAISIAANKWKVNIAVPQFLLHIPLGDFAESLYLSLKCSPHKIEEAGFKFQYSSLQATLESLIKEK